MRSFITHTLRHYQVKGGVMGRACSMHGEKRHAYRVLVEKKNRRKDITRKTDVGRRIIIK
jgi:hypothetical protein